MPFYPMSWLVKGFATVKASKLPVHHRTAFHTAVLQPDFPGRLPTIITAPSAFISVKRGRVKFGELAAILPSATRRSPISSAVIPSGLPFFSTSRIMALRLGHFGLTCSYASRRSRSAILIRINPFYSAVICLILTVPVYNSRRITMSLRSQRWALRFYCTYFVCSTLRIYNTKNYVGIKKSPVVTAVATPLVS